MKRLILFTIITLLINELMLFAQAGYPTPPPTDKMLFYLQRSHNKNTIIYDLNTYSDGKLNKDNPIKIYWLRYEEGGRLADLSFIQKNAFGAKCTLSDKVKESYTVRFNQFDKREIQLIKSISGKYKAYMNINNDFAELSHVFIKSENNALGMPIKVKYIEFHGVSAKSKKLVLEVMFL